MTMTSSTTLLAALKAFEGCRLTAYKPVKTERYFTIGYGHYGADVKRNMRITESKAEELLRQDLNKFERSINALNVCKTQGQFDALVDFSYNLGLANLTTSTLLQKIRAGVNSPTLESDCKALFDEDKMPKDLTREEMFDIVVGYQFLRWNKSSGKVLPGLTKRRQWEAQRWAE